MSDVLERFLRYVQVGSQSDPLAERGRVPSAACEHVMARLLGTELEALGCDDVLVDDHAYVTASFPASPGAEDLPALGLCCHLDTSPDAPGEGVRPRVVHYEGGPLMMGIVDGRVVSVAPDELPDLERLVGQDIVCTDGRTLLSADDKAGVAEVCALLSELSTHPELPHPCLKIAFVPDEEIGHGARLLDLERFGATWCYTVDGGPLGEFNYECFCASEATVSFRGTMVHPGSAKGVMVNALSLAAEFAKMVPFDERPEFTEGREGFYHPIRMEGTAAQATLVYILRDFDAHILEQREARLHRIALTMNERLGAQRVTVSVHQQYRNMAEEFEGREFLIEHALEANREVGIEPWIEPIRGGTDGAQLIYRGLPCPNLAAGGYLMHSVREFVPVRSLELTVLMLERLVAKFTVPQAG